MIGHYRVEREIGRGGMGTVYLAEDRKLGRSVDIKLLLDEVSADPERLARFEREARVLASLNHNNIATLYGFEKEGDTSFLVMELVEGETLAERIKRGAVPVDEALALFLQIAEGLGAAHEKGVIHRDLKPANIKVTEEGAVKILDFGLVHEDSSDMTKTGHVMGTPNYMSPEQVQGLPIDPRSDIFSLGAVFYELLTRKKPFSAESMHATMFKVVQGEREPLSQYTHLPSAIVGMVDRALDPNPDGRFADGNALREHLVVFAKRRLPARARARTRP